MNGWESGEQGMNADMRESSNIILTEISTLFEKLITNCGFWGRAVGEELG